AGAGTEMVLFPGLLIPLLALAAFLLSKPNAQHRNDESGVRSPNWGFVTMLDVTAISSAIVVVLSIGYDVFKLHLFGRTILTATDPDRALFILSIAVMTRCCIAYPRVLRVCMSGERSLRETVRSPVRSELFAHALVWATVGFLGSFGLNLFFHRVLYEFVPIFSGMRVATRWAMICYVGLALLAGLGASRLANNISNHWSKLPQTAIYMFIILAILFELNTAPLRMIR